MLRQQSLTKEQAPRFYTLRHLKQQIHRVRDAGSQQKREGMGDYRSTGMQVQSGKLKTFRKWKVVITPQL